jgi:thiol:disulfide interchange protein DsbC
MNMNTKSIAVFTALFATFGSAVSFADEKTDIEKVRVELQKMIPQAVSAEIVASPVEGVYRLQLQGNYAFAYVAGDYVLMGDLYDTKSQVNLGDQASSERMASLLKDVPTSKMIVYGPENPKRHMTVFTDIDCGYCRKLHNEVAELNAAGIEVRYLAFPRAGIGSASHKKYVSVWCSDDQQTALTSAKAGATIAAASCDNPIEETYKLGKQLGVKGTPTIIFDDGTVAPGYVPSVTLIERLGLNG